MVIHDLPTGAMRHLSGFLDELDRLAAEIVQTLPEECVPIRNGARFADLGYVTSTGGGKSNGLSAHAGIWCITIAFQTTVRWCA